MPPPFTPGERPGGAGHGDAAAAKGDGLRTQLVAPSSDSSPAARRLLYQDWPGNNRFCCSGHLMMGPRHDWPYNLCAWASILVPSACYFRASAAPASCTALSCLSAHTRFNTRRLRRAAAVGAHDVAAALLGVHAGLHAAVPQPHLLHRPGLPASPGAARACAGPRDSATVRDAGGAAAVHVVQDLQDLAPAQGAPLLVSSAPARAAPARRSHAGLSALIRRRWRAEIAGTASSATTTIAPS